MLIAVPRERGPRERRVSLVPETVARITKMNHRVLVEEGAGMASGFSDQQYRDAGAEVARSEQGWM